MLLRSRIYWKVPQQLLALSGGSLQRRDMSGFGGRSDSPHTSRERREWAEGDLRSETASGHDQRGL